MFKTQMEPRAPGMWFVVWLQSFGQFIEAAVLQKKLQGAQRFQTMRSMSPNIKAYIQKVSLSGCPNSKIMLVTWGTLEPLEDSPVNGIILWSIIGVQTMGKCDWFVLYHINKFLVYKIEKHCMWTHMHCMWQLVHAQ